MKNVNKNIYFVLCVYAICVLLRIAVGLYFNDKGIDILLNQFSWVSTILFFVTMIYVGKNTINTKNAK
ncbi:hypothetical protein HNP25_001990 [Arcicella rosea]|uniref:Uncharacterized protein n=1 Tax=Arcicella rosea TaxID=502909 RepID=A0A841EMC1_9BACT|nr:hypothetical protein [Arcicella rosea]